ncbi:MAG: FtsX-like permease family protein [Candidatus Methylacidiphilales bacterium]|nr:FtsX-like permease family protein [Candidatus Methylacidiphilales bacterium]
MNTSSYHIAAGFLWAHKRSMGMTVLGVAVGVGLFIAALAQAQGFEAFFIKTLLGCEGSVVITDRFQSYNSRILAGDSNKQVMVSSQQQRKYYPGIADAYHIIDVLSHIPDVVGCSPVVEGNAILRSGFASDVVLLRGVDLELHLRTTEFRNQIIKGSLDDFRANPSGICVGSVLAERLRLSVGQNVYLSGSDHSSRRYRIDAIYETGVWMMDTRNVFVHMRSAQTLLRKPYYTSLMYVKLRDPMRAGALAEAFEDLLSHSAASWQERQRGNLQIFKLLRISAGLVVSMVILLSGFGIYNVLSISVMQRSKEIAILRSMGFRKNDITMIFLWQGVWVAVVGIVGGWIFGACMTYGISKIPVNITGIMRTRYFLVEWSMDHYLMAAVLALVSVTLAAYIPARRASRIEPAGILRGTGQ